MRDREKKRKREAMEVEREVERRELKTYRWIDKQIGEKKLSKIKYIVLPFMYTNII